MARDASVDTLLTTSPAAAHVTVMSYNIEGLPPPARFGRAAYLKRVGQELARLRKGQRQPNVVLLQEAFTAPAKQIAQDAGYRYVADGPSAGELNTTAPPIDARPFVAAASHLRGENDGKWVDSGLRILSDYPIVKIKRLAFPAWACAGYDCLANKGMMIAWIKLPGSPEPIAFIDTHLNSRGASGVEDLRSDTAYMRQIEALRQFIRAEVPASTTAFLGGDFNSKAEVRRAAVSSLLPHSHNSLLDALRRGSAITLNDRADTEAILRRSKDWLFYRGDLDVSVRLTAFEVPFGRQANGSMLSDHLGYEARYRLRTAAPRPEERRFSPN